MRATRFPRYRGGPNDRIPIIETQAKHAERVEADHQRAEVQARIDRVIAELGRVPAHVLKRRLQAEGLA